MPPVYAYTVWRMYTYSACVYVCMYNVCMYVCMYYYHTCIQHVCVCVWYNVVVLYGYPLSALVFSGSSFNPALCASVDL